jgi:hypothetical protein
VNHARVVVAWCLLIGAIIAWPVTAFTIFSDEPPGILGLSYLAIILEAASLLTSSQVRKDQADGD